MLDALILLDERFTFWHSFHFDRQTNENVRINEFVRFYLFIFYFFSFLGRGSIYLFLFLRSSLFLWYIFKCGLFCSTNCEREIFCSLMSKIVDQTMTSYWNRNDILFGVCVCVWWATDAFIISNPDESCCYYYYVLVLKHSHTDMIQVFMCASSHTFSKSCNV